MRLITRILCVGFVLAVTAENAAAQSRTRIDLDKGWQFTKETIDPAKIATPPNTQAVTLPHTWNAFDVMDDVPGYYRGACWYTRSINITKADAQKELYLYLKGANQEAEVYVNGQKAGAHIGGYTAFCVPLNKFLKFGASNTIAIKVDNKFNEDSPPLTADFTFYGGLYRDVYLLKTNKVHFSLDNAASGIAITTPHVSADNASVQIKGDVVGGPFNKQISATLYDAAGKTVSTTKLSVSGENFSLVMPGVSNPHLWSVDAPYLYKMVCRVLDAKSGAVLDEVSQKIGLRWYKFDSEKGFFLNGKPLKLIGASRHQDFEGKGNALTAAYHVRDVSLLKQMGGNFLRVAHYPQDQKVLEACDSLGILASVEIPVVNAITESAAFTQNSKNMLVEMIHQNYNHPSIIIWAYMNEVLLRPKFGDDKPRQQIYFGHVKQLAATLDSTARAEDPTRYTMIACHGDYNRYKQVGLVDIPKLIGWNLYQGWYGGKTEDFAKFLDKFHQDYPSLPMLITEYGADADSRIRSLTPERFDKSVEYAVDFHKIYLEAMMTRPFITAGIIWNLADFNSEERAESTPHINSKGLLTWDRKPKDVYFFYQANLLKKPFIRISNWSNRSGISDSTNHRVATQPLMVFSNAAFVSLKLNGKNLGSKNTISGMATYDVPFVNGLNTVEAGGIFNGKLVKDQSIIKFNLLERKLAAEISKDLNINVLLGAKRYFIDEAGKVWSPAMAYQPGSFGFVGGIPYKQPGNNRQSYGSDRNISKTIDDPIYQTQQTGIQHFRFDVPAGKYELTLHFAELTTDKKIEALAYNLDNQNQKQALEDRIFSVDVNGKPFLSDFCIAKKYGPLTAGAKKIVVTVTGNSGIDISFKAQKGELVLNAVQLKGL